MLRYRMLYFHGHCASFINSDTPAAGFSWLLNFLHVLRSDFLVMT